MAADADEAEAEPSSFDGAPGRGSVDVSATRAYVEDIARWVIGDAVGGQLADGQCDALARELGAILATGLAPALARDVRRNTEKVIADLQDGPVSFDGNGRLTVGGFTVTELVRVLGAVGQLVDYGAGEALQRLHDSHRNVLLRVHDVWMAKRD